MTALGEDYPWIYLSEHWDRLKGISDKRTKQKSGYSSTRIFNGVDSHFIGICGEKAVSILTGLPLNEELLIHGDGGLDFPFTNVKATQHWLDPWLIEFTNPKKKLPFYILAAVDLKKQRAWVPGFVTMETMFDAPLRDWKHGKRHSIQHNDPKMHPMDHYRLAVAWHKDRL